MVPIKEALTFDDVTLAPKYSEILPSEVNTGVQLTKNLKLKILLSNHKYNPDLACIGSRISQPSKLKMFENDQKHQIKLKKLSRHKKAQSVSSLEKLTITGNKKLVDLTAAAGNSQKLLIGSHKVIHPLVKLDRHSKEK